MTKSANSRVIMVKNVPHGFYEKEMMEFFSQFGPVTRLKLLRSRKVSVFLMLSNFEQIITYSI